ncbi:MAG: phospho-N-acetylmuramoyl-pentapeptide-transferase [Planctomycetes bacterium]|nr:phospho-N-acetylmuramoyl-pentapeptide-transferase [Planctomycetota bacterium]
MGDVDVGVAAVASWLGGLTALERSQLAAGTALAVVLLAAPPVIGLFRCLGLVEPCDKTDSPEIAQRHGPKRGTVTMGGVLLMGAALLSAGLWARWDGVLLPSIAGVMLAFGAIGALDDLIKIRHRFRKGLGRQGKMLFLGTVALAAATVTYAYFVVQGAAAGTAIQIPVVGWILPIGPLFVVVALVVLTSSANAVNLTDGLDGLAVGLLVLSFLAFAVLALVAGTFVLATRYGVLFVAGATEVAVFTAALAGAGLGFLFYNRHPARIFMGDTGALAMGGALGMVALCIRQEFLLPVIGGVFVAEAGSVILQIWCYRRYGQRIFLCAPLHHHFEFRNWPETRITRRFWLAGAVLCAVALLGTLGGR